MNSYYFTWESVCKYQADKRTCSLIEEKFRLVPSGDPADTIFELFLRRFKAAGYLSKRTRYIEVVAEVVNVTGIA